MTFLGRTAMTCGIACLGGALIAGADETHSAGELEELTVTARKREEPLEKTPVAVTVLTAEDLQRSFVLTLTDVSGSIPNVAFHSVGEFGHSSSLSIRGIGGGGANLDADPAVAIYVDGLYQTANSYNLEDLFGVESVEILRGPQGTLFGRNAFGGAINITTKNPTATPSVESELTVGNFGRKNLDAAANFSLLEHLDARVDMIWANSAGLYRNSLDNGKPIGADATIALRSTLVYRTDDGPRVQLKYNFIDDQSDPTPNKYDADPPGNLFSILSPTQYANFGTTNIGPKGTGGPFDVGFTSICKCNFMKENSVSLKMDEPTRVGDLTSIAGWQHVRGSIQTDATGTPIPLLMSVLPYSISTFTEELRLNTGVTDRLNLTGGFFYLNSSLTESDALYIMLNSGTSSTKQSLQQTDSAALFVEGEYTLPDAVRVTLGSRETTETKHFRFGAAVPVAYADVAPPPGYLYSPSFNTWRNFAPKVTVDRQLARDELIYATWSRGFKAGGYQALATAAENAGPYGDETVSATELGIKSFLWEHRVRLNGDIFYDTLHGLQRSVTSVDSAGNSNNLTLNAADAVTRGFEAEGALLPIDSLTISGSVGFTDAHYTNFCANFTPLNATRPRCGTLPGAVDNTNLTLANAPKWTIALRLDWVVPMATGLAAMRVEQDYATHSFTEDDNSPVSARAAAYFLNASFKWSRSENTGYVQLWGRNLTDRIVTEQGTLAAPLLGIWNPVAPRTFGVSIGGRY